MLEEKNFQVGFLVIQILTLLLVGVFIFPFALKLFEDFSKLPQFPIWGVEIFFAILTIIIIVVTYKLTRIASNKFKFAHLFLCLANVGVFIFQIAFCVLRMSGN